MYCQDCLYQLLLGTGKKLLLRSDPRVTDFSATVMNGTHLKRAAYSVINTQHVCKYCLQRTMSSAMYSKFVIHCVFTALVYTVEKQKLLPLYTWPQRLQFLTDFQNPFTARMRINLVFITNFYLIKIHDNTHVNKLSVLYFYCSLSFIRS